MASTTFSVFVEGAVTPGERALDALAHAMAERYGLPAADLLVRMKKGRFRVKANVDRATAETYVRDLKAIGARAVLEDAAAATVAAPPVAVPRTMTPAPQFQSGLAAAFSPASETATTDLGALSGDVPIKLASLDGRAESQSDVGAIEAEDARFTPPAMAAATAAAAPKAKPKSAAALAGMANEPIDMFAPPDEGAELKVDIAPDELDYRRSKPSIPVPMAPAASGDGDPPVVTLRKSGPSLAPANRTSTPAIGAAAVGAGEARPPAAAAGVLANARARFAIGVALAVVIGFVPAHFLASVREKSADTTIDERVVATQRSLPPDQIDAYRATELDTKRGAHRNIALVSLLVWAVVGGGVGFAWHRKFRDA